MTLRSRDSVANQLDEVFDRASKMLADPDVQADYARYLCVLVTGYLERSVRKTILDFVDLHGNPRFSRYIEWSLRPARNMRAKEILDILKRFDDGWKLALEGKLTLRHREAIGSVYANRNKIAHGEDVDLAYRQIRADYDLVKEAVRFLEDSVK
ncbi:MAG: hypothetical protein F4X45_01835 [Chloroflexi bacterium]|nr:hypothetical protein [Chloroflexota bacterium]